MHNLTCNTIGKTMVLASLFSCGRRIPSFQTVRKSKNLYQLSLCIVQRRTPALRARTPDVHRPQQSGSEWQMAKGRISYVCMYVCTAVYSKGSIHIVVGTKRTTRETKRVYIFFFPLLLRIYIYVYRGFSLVWTHRDPPFKSSPPHMWFEANELVGTPSIVCRLLGRRQESTVVVVVETAKELWIQAITSSRVIVHLPIL